MVSTELLAALWKAIRDFEPDYLFCPPFPSDALAGIHVDHVAVAEAVRKVAYMINVPHAFTPEYPADESKSEPCKVPVINTKLVGIRHAETLWNRERRYQGRQDPPLSETGRVQADAVGQLLAKERIEAVWSSPLRRARETAEAIATLRGLTVRVDDQFGEMHFGQWEGLTSEEVSAKFPEMYRTWLDTPARRCPT
jgi:LmbE family N-acetylglucosaminyl deacetylase